ncbi:hypothetical protein QWA68_014181 [Fusarium oxysporum]|nr:hypothetical protein QWA68_014181 [Fusarium oxysporum]
MGNSSSKAEKENEAALNGLIDSYNDNSLVKFNRFFSGDKKISHVSTSSTQDTNSARDLGIFTGGFSAGSLTTSFMYDNSRTNTYVYEYHNHGSGPQTFNFFNSV